MCCCITFVFEVYKCCFRIVLTTVAKLKLGWRVTLSGTALDASGAKVQRNNERIIEIDANSSEYAKKMQKSLVDCKKVCNFAAVFQIYVNKEQCCNKE